MGYDVLLNNNIIGTLGTDNKINYDTNAVNHAITEMIAGQSGKSSGTITNARVSYRWNSSRLITNNNMYSLWKTNPIIQNRVTQLNALIFGKGIKCVYDDKQTQEVINRFWRTNKLRSKLDAISTDAQLYGEVFIGLYPQPSGDIMLTAYESSQVTIDFDPANPNAVNRYIVAYKNEETGKDEQFDMMPISNFINNIEYSNPVNSKIINKVRKLLGINIKIDGGKGVMAHVKFNCASNEIHGTSDFKQIYDIVADYINFVGDRLSIHQLYGCPSYDITIDTDDNKVIMDRIEELANFQIGSNPVHNKQETWKPLEFQNGALDAKDDNAMLRGLLCAGTGFPEYLLFNQDATTADNTFALNKIAENRQQAFHDMFMDIHKFVVAIAGLEISNIDKGQIVFPEISTMSEKSKAETYVLKVGANICSRKTACMNMGHNWDIEQIQITEERELLGDLMDNSDFAGAIGGRFTTKVNGENSEDDGTDDRKARAESKNITTQIMGDRKTNN